MPDSSVSPPVSSQLHTSFGMIPVEVKFLISFPKRKGYIRGTSTPPPPMHTYVLTCSHFHGLKNALRSKVVTGDAGDTEAESLCVRTIWAYDKGVGWKDFKGGGVLL